MILEKGTFCFVFLHQLKTMNVVGGWVRWYDNNIIISISPKDRMTRLMKVIRWSDYICVRCQFYITSFQTGQAGIQGKTFWERFWVLIIILHAMLSQCTLH